MDQETRTNSQDNSAQAGADGGAAAGQEDQGNQAQPEKKPEGISQEAYRALQSRADKTEAELRKMRESHERDLAAARESGRQATLATLKPEERDAQIRAWKLEDREIAIRQAERDQESVARELTVARLTLNNSLTADDVAELEKIDDVNEMRARAAEMKAERLAKELEEARKGGDQQKAAGEEKKVPAGMRGDPAGSGSGGSQGAYDPAKFKGTGDLAGSLRAQREAGQVKYERIPSRGR